MSDRYVLTGGLLNKLRDTVRTVDGMTGGEEEPTRVTFSEAAYANRPIRIGTFGTAAWSINSSNTVTLTNVGVTGYTVLATNVFGSLPAGGATQNCAVAKDGTAWYLIQPFLNTASGGLIRMGTFSSPWSKGETKTVSLTNAGGTVASSNTLIDYPAPPAGKSSVNCVVANDGGTWFLANWEVVPSTAIIVSGVSSATVITDVSISASLNTTSCAITIGKTNTTASFSFVSSTYTTTIIRLA
jgi:hypothetical protein